MSKPTYTEADVAQLVTVCDRLDRLIGMPVNLREDLTTALKPFQPDPEEALIEKMTVAYTRSMGLKHPSTDTTSRIRAMADVLAVVKREGLPT